MSLGFLVILGVLIPLAARRDARVLQGTHPDRPELSTEQLWRSAILTQLILLALALYTGSRFGFRVFSVGRINGTDLLWTAGALGALFALRELSRLARSEEEIRDLVVFRRAPRTAREVRLFTVAVLIAGVAEEAAYRGVGWSILIFMFGDAWSTAAAMSLVFALAHWSQGWKSVVTIVAVALVFHGLVALSGTLLLAMAIHIIYDLVAGYDIRRRAMAFDRQSVRTGGASAL